jgi:hypothetical protein
MEGRRWSDGLHQAVEAKENVKVEAATQTFATITLQNYFRMYHKLAGMTGTAETEAGEFWSIYKLDVVVIPTNRPVIRDDQDDLIYKTKKAKYAAVINRIEELRNSGRPVLVGTTDVETSELLSKLLRLRGIKHNVLNAKEHAREAEIVAQAGQSSPGQVPVVGEDGVRRLEDRMLGAVTIATNMAGRGTDLKLIPEVKAAGGLFIQMLPGASEEAVDALENMLKDLKPITAVIEEAVTDNPTLSMEGLLQKMMDMIFGGMPEDYQVKALSYREIKWECDCSYDRLEQVLASIGEQDLREIVEEDGEAELTCQFCRKKYHFDKDALLGILDRYTKKAE